MSTDTPQHHNEEGKGPTSGGLVLRVRGLRKNFGGVQALAGVDLDVRAGECHGLVGANGAGKSTLGKILAGVHRPDAGSIEVFGRVVHITSPSTAERLGIGLVPQEPMVAPNLSVADNLALGREQTSFVGSLRKYEEHQRAVELLAKVGLGHLSPTTLVQELDVAERQLLQVARALGADARLLILDEPTSAITASEADNLFGLLRRLQDQGVTLIYVSHRLEEIFTLCDSITVMRDGQVAGDFRTADTTVDEVIEAMAGAAGAEAITAQAAAGRLPPPEGQVLLEVKGLSSPPTFEDISFSVRGGEIVGLAGLVGAGRSEVLRAIVGIDRPASGEVLVAGKPARFVSAAQAIADGVVLLPEDRQAQGLMPQLGVRANLSISILQRLVRALGFLDVAREREMARGFVARLKVQCAHIDQPVRDLSGGNQQKVMVARTLACEPRVVLLDEPTRGVDVSAKADIHHWVREFARSGMAVVIVSSELQEVAALSHRVLVLREGRLVAEVPGEQATEKSLLALAAKPEDQGV
ncbi:MAG: sugar ABC transporter ATP-binding protein [Armatimonadetes bacterium]|nr:sugar ABC transporter ATP-binding protein [Armatimonadota bacterium]